MHSTGRPVGVVLCGGESRRMGFPKPFLPVEGSPLCLRVARRLESVADDVVLSVRTSRPYRSLPYPLVADRVPGRGPLEGIRSCLAAHPGRGLLVLSCDAPLVDPCLLNYLALFGNVYDVVVPVSERGPEPLAGYYGPAARPALERYLGEGRTAATGFLDRVHAFRLPLRRTVWAREGAMFANLNTPVEFVNALPRLREAVA